MRRECLRALLALCGRVLWVCSLCESARHVEKDEDLPRSSSAMSESRFVRADGSDPAARKDLDDARDDDGALAFIVDKAQPMNAQNGKSAVVKKATPVLCHRHHRDHVGRRRLRRRRVCRRDLRRRDWKAHESQRVPAHKRLEAAQGHHVFYPGAIWSVRRAVSFFVAHSVHRPGSRRRHRPRTRVPTRYVTPRPGVALSYQHS